MNSAMNDDLLIACSVACGFFARVLRPGVDADLLRQCAQERMFQSWPVPGIDGDRPPGLELVDGALAGLDDDRLAMIEEDNTVLFIGPEAPIPMWESVWTTEERLLFADCTTAVEQDFNRFGFECPGAGREPSDHLAYELAFIAALLARAADHARSRETDAARRHVEAAAQFLDQHLARWAPACLAEVAEHARSDFYRGVALLCTCTLAGLPTHLETAQASH
jgi:TorA maturation chaperone TorD